MRVGDTISDRSIPHGQSAIIPKMKCMKKILLFPVFTLAFFLGGVMTVSAAGGFDEFGYNDGARIFNGLADGVDRVLDDKLWGDEAYANDRVVMKWNEEWDLCNENGNDNPDYCLGAWTDNEWNGKVRGGSGEVWHYKIIWVGSGLENSPYWVEGGYPIWGNYEVIMDQGISTSDYCGPNNGGHQFCALAGPNGYGVK